MPTIRDVATKCGVSTATVSNVLNGRIEHVGPATRERIWAAVREMGYRPAPLDRRQRSNLNRNLVLLAQDLTEAPFSNGYYREALEGVLEIAGLRGWGVTLLVHRMWAGEASGNLVRRSYDGRCDGVICVAPVEQNEIVRALHDRGTPLCFIGTTPTLTKVSSVDVDNHAIGRKAAEFLKALGHRRLGFVGHARPQCSSLERSKAMREACQKHGVPFEAISVPANMPIEKFCDEIVRRNAPLPTGLLCWHDGLARALVNGLSARGVSIPQDLSIIGVDDDASARQDQIQLTSFSNPIGMIGRTAARVMIDRLEAGHEMRSPESIRFEPTLIVRGSTGPSTNLLPDSRHRHMPAIGANGGPYSI